MLVQGFDFVLAQGFFARLGAAHRNLVKCHLCDLCLGSLASYQAYFSLRRETVLEDKSVYFFNLARAQPLHAPLQIKGPVLGLLHQFLLLRRRVNPQRSHNLDVRELLLLRCF